MLIAEAINHSASADGIGKEPSEAATIRGSPFASWKDALRLQVAGSRNSRSPNGQPDFGVIIAQDEGSAPPQVATREIIDRGVNQRRWNDGRSLITALKPAWVIADQQAPGSGNRYWQDRFVAADQWCRVADCEQKGTHSDEQR
jgi:hypothetical protein